MIEAHLRGDVAEGAGDLSDGDERSHLEHLGPSQHQDWPPLTLADLRPEIIVRRVVHEPSLRGHPVTDMKDLRTSVLDRPPVALRVDDYEGDGVLIGCCDVVKLLPIPIRAPIRAPRPGLNLAAKRGRVGIT